MSKFCQWFTFRSAISVNISARYTSFLIKKKSLDGNVAYVLKKQRKKLNPISQYMINLFKGTEMFYKRNVVNGIFLQ